MSAISLAITQLFSALSVLFTACESMAHTINNIAEVGKEASGAYKDQTRIDRLIKQNKQAEDLLASAPKQITSDMEEQGISQLKALTDQLSQLQASLPKQAQ